MHTMLQAAFAGSLGEGLHCDWAGFVAGKIRDGCHCSLLPSPSGVLCTRCGDPGLFLSRAVDCCARAAGHLLCSRSVSDYVDCHAAMCASTRQRKSSYARRKILVCVAIKLGPKVGGPRCFDFPRWPVRSTTVPLPLGHRESPPREFKYRGDQTSSSANTTGSEAQ